MKEAPKKIYLQWDGETELSEGQITWCVDRINDSDVEYDMAKLMGEKLAAANKVIFEAGQLMGEKLLELKSVKEEVNRLTRLLMEVGE